jgi:hypothetical protein
MCRYTISAERLRAPTGPKGAGKQRGNGARKTLYRRWPGKSRERAAAKSSVGYLRQENLGEPEPFLTETLADYTEDAAEAVAQYRRALAQSVGCCDEPTHTKRICMASRLIELGDLDEARLELMLGRVEAERLSHS